MRKVVLLTFVLLTVASMLLAQNPGSIGIFSDQLGNDCNIAEVATPGVVEVYVVHVLTTGAVASQFYVKATNVSWTYTGETSPFSLKIGNTQDPVRGISLTYQACLTGSIFLVSVSYFSLGSALPTPICGLFSIEAPDSTTTGGNVEILDCDLVRHVLPKGGEARVNPDGSCTCNVPNQQATWGRIKALYN